MKSQEIYTELKAENSINVGDDESNFVSLGYEDALAEIEQFVEYSATNNFEIFKNEIDGRGRSIVSPGNYARKCISRFGYWMKAYDERYIYSETVDLFFRLCETMKISHMDFRRSTLAYQGQLVSGLELFDKFVTNIRGLRKSAAFKAKVAKRKHNYKRNYESLAKYIEALFSLHARLMTLRIDFAYRAEMINELTPEVVHQHRERLLNNLRGNKIFKNMAGYIWKLEYGTQKGYHFHFIFFFDGSQVQKDEYKAHQIGMYWQDEITRGIGVHYNCNRNKSKYKHCGIGMINYHDAEMRSNLLIAVKYLAKKEQYLRARLKTHMRLFGRGELPQHRPTRPGRPRRNNAGLSSLGTNGSLASHCPSSPSQSSS